MNALYLLIDFVHDMYHKLLIFPFLFNIYLSLKRPGQEEGNVPYVEDSGFGTYSGDPKTIAETVSTWLSSPEQLQTMKDAALEASRPSATVDIAKALAEMLFKEKELQRSLERTREPVLVAK